MGGTRRAGDGSIGAISPAFCRPGNLPSTSFFGMLLNYDTYKITAANTCLMVAWHIVDAYSVSPSAHLSE